MKTTLSYNQLKALKEYIDAAITDALDKRESSDEGLLSSIQKHNAWEDIEREFEE